MIGLSIVLLSYIYVMLDMRWQQKQLHSLTTSFQIRVNSAAVSVQEWLSSMSSLPTLPKRWELVTFLLNRTR